jgi:hypothetical protein
MTWADYDGEGILVTQQKTGTKLDLPVHSELKSIGSVHGGGVISSALPT